MTETKKFLDGIGVTTSFRKVETYNISQEYQRYQSRIGHFCYCFEVISEKNGTKEQFFITKEIPEIYDQLIYVIQDCIWAWVMLVRMYRLFGNDFSELLHCVLIDAIKNDRDINSLALTIVDLPEASEKSLRLILTQDLPKDITDKALRHKHTNANIIAFS